MLERTKDSKKRARLEAELELPPLPRCLVYLWNIFLRLSNRRPMGFGVGLVPWSEIVAFQAATGVRLRRWEIEQIEALDQAYVASRAKKQKSEQE